MIRTLLATTALVALVHTGAHAQTQPATPQAEPQMENAPIFRPDSTYSPSVTAEGYVTADPKQVLATNLIGQSVYSATSDSDGDGTIDSSAIGDVNDIVIGEDGGADAVVIGVGGFLGIGEKDVAVDFNALTWVARDGERYLTVNATTEQLEAAPAFDRSVYNVAVVQPAEQMQTGTDNQTAAVPPVQKDQTTAMESGDDPFAGATAADIAAVEASELIGTRVYSADSEDVGEVADLIVTDDGKVEAFVVDVGGFLGIGEKRVAMQAANVELLRDGDGDMLVRTSFTRDQFDAAAAYDEAKYLQDKSASSM